ncbi:MAG: class I SAM-dependent methyltransferase [Roseburia sp.]|nr:class I SAM-dependent methyltransferase [Roseburia sp.]
MRNITDYEQQYMEHSFERYQEGYRKRLTKSVIRKYAKEGSSVVEIGCGPYPLFTDYEGEYLFTVIEPAKTWYENACTLAKEYGNVSCYQGFLGDFVRNIRGETFDIVICSSLLHEVENPRQLLRDIRLLCNHGTIVHVNVPNAFSLHRLMAKEMGLIRDVHQMSGYNLELQQHTVFDMDMLKELVGQEGYRVIDSGSCFLKPFTHKQMQQCMDAQILNEDILEALDGLCVSHFKEYGSEIYVNLQLK